MVWFSYQKLYQRCAIFAASIFRIYYSQLLELRKIPWPKSAWIKLTFKNSKTSKHVFWMTRFVLDSGVNFCLAWNQIAGDDRTIRYFSESCFNIVHARLDILKFQFFMLTCCHFTFSITFTIQMSKYIFKTQLLFDFQTAAINIQLAVIICLDTITRYY